MIIEQNDYLNKNHSNLNIKKIDSGDVDIIKRIQDACKYIKSDFLILYGDTISDVNIRDLHLLHLKAWKKKLKTLYYCRSEAVKRAEIISTKIERKVRPDSKEGCLACEA